MNLGRTVRYWPKICSIFVDNILDNASMFRYTDGNENSRKERNSMCKLKMKHFGKYNLCKMCSRSFIKLCYVGSSC